MARASRDPFGGVCGGQSPSGQADPSSEDRPCELKCLHGGCLK